MVFLDLLLISAGLTVLISGAALTVQTASRLAASFGVSRIVIGATVVAFGTSAPEFVVSLLSASRDAPGLAIGNVLGSNVANVALVLGASAAVRPLTVHRRLLKWEIPVLCVATLVVLVSAMDGSIQRSEGILMFAGLIAFIIVSPRLWPETSQQVDEELNEFGSKTKLGARSLAMQSGILVMGLAGLTIGAELAVRGAVSIAQRLMISEVAIGATIVATGTSLPEVATSVVAAFRREHEIAVANVVGSNIFNLLGVLGLTASVISLDVGRELNQFELPALVLSTAILLPLAWPRLRIGRIEGGTLLLLYASFVTVMLLRS